MSSSRLQPLIQNPLTGRWITRDGKLHRQLQHKGYLPTEPPSYVLNRLPNVHAVPTAMHSLPASQATWPLSTLPNPLYNASSWPAPIAPKPSVLHDAPHSTQAHTKTLKLKHPPQSKLCDNEPRVSYVVDPPPGSPTSQQEDASDEDEIEDASSPPSSATVERLLQNHGAELRQAYDSPHVDFVSFVFDLMNKYLQ